MQVAANVGKIKRGGKILIAALVIGGILAVVLVLLFTGEAVQSAHEQVDIYTHEQQMRINNNQGDHYMSVDVAEGFSNIREGLKSGGGKSGKKSGDGGGGLFGIGKKTDAQKKADAEKARKEKAAAEERRQKAWDKRSKQFNKQDEEKKMASRKSLKRNRQVKSEEIARVDFNGENMESPYPKKCTWNTCQKIINYQIMGSFNSCARSNRTSSCTSTLVDKNELKNVLLSGYRFIDFELYSVKGNCVVGIGGARYQYTKCPTDPANSALLQSLKANGTYGITDHPDLPFIPIKDALEVVSSIGFGQADNKANPLFILFRIKSFNANIYIQLASAIKKTLQYKLLPKSYGRDGNLLINNHKSIIDLPIYALNRKAIICVEDHCKLYEQPEAKDCYDLINMVVGGKYLSAYSHDELINVAIPEMRSEAHNKIIIGYPDYKTNDSLQQQWTTMHTKGVQVAMVRYRTIVCDPNQKYHKNLIGSSDSSGKRLSSGYHQHFDEGAFKLKPKAMLKPKDIVSADIQPRTSPEKSLTADTTTTDFMGNKQTIKGAN